MDRSLHSRSRSPWRRQARMVARWGGRLAVLLALAALGLGGAPLGSVAQAPDDFAPATGHAQVIAQGVVAMPEEEVAWRAVRGRAEPVAEAAVAERPLGFVLATGAPLLLIDGESGQQSRLGRGEAALVPAGSQQQWASAGEERASFLALELVPVGAEPEAAGNLLLEGDPFQPPSGLRDLDLVRDVLAGDDAYELPDTGQQNLILATDGAVAVEAAGGEATTLLAGEGGTFVGGLTVSAADGETQAAFVAAIIGPEVAPAAIAPTPTPEPAPTPTAAADESPPTETPATDADADADADEAAAEVGTITLQVFTCPAGMRPETLAAAACSAADGEEFDVTLAGDALDAPLTLNDAAAGERAATYTWADLPFGRYRLAQEVLPAGYDTYTLSAADTAGDPEAGYVVTLDPDAPELLVRIYNFAPADDA